MAAAAGTLAVLLPQDDVLVRVMLNSLATAGAALLIVPMSMLIGREVTRPAGLFGIAVVVCEFILATALIWLSLVLSGSTEEHVGITMLFLGLTGLMGFTAFLLVGLPHVRFAGIIGIVVSGLTFLASLVAIWGPRPTDDEWAMTGVVLGCFGSLGVACLTSLGTGRVIRPWIGAASAVVAAGLFLAEIWANLPWDDEQALAVATSIPAFLAFDAICAHFRLPGRQRWLRIATVAAAATTAIGWDVVALGDYWHDTFIGRLTAAAAIVSGCGFLAQLVLQPFNRRGEVSRRLAEHLRMPIACPRCDFEQEIGVGKTACAACGLRIELRVEEPSCPNCDYLLYECRSARCPECGHLIRGSVKPPTGSETGQASAAPQS
ncbi:MAG: hypothetical protein ACYTGR_15485 [Planctomycetota bacterium]|jgi:hypothetical protein